MKLQILAFLFLTCFSITGFSKSEVVAIVQYTDGESHTNESKEPLQFKDLILSNQQINVKEKSKLKIVLSNSCIAVLYGPASLKFSNSLSSPIELTGSSRWICKNSEQKLNYNNQEYDIKKSEILIYNNKIAIVDGDTKLDEKTLEDLDKEYPYPSESARTDINIDLHKHYDTRIVLNGAPLGWGGFSHATSDYTNSNLQVSGVKLGAQFKLWDKNWFTFLSYLSQDSSNQSKGNGPLTSGNFSHTQVKLIGVGLRQEDLNIDHSLYYYGGIGALMLQTGIPNNFNGIINYNALFAGVGYEKIFFSKSWISLYVSAELQLAQTIFNGYVQTNYSAGFGGPPFAEPTGSITAYNIFLNIGPSFQF